MAKLELCRGIPSCGGHQDGSCFVKLHQETYMACCPSFQKTSHEVLQPQAQQHLRHDFPRNIIACSLLGHGRSRIERLNRINRQSITDWSWPQRGFNGVEIQVVMEAAHSSRSSSDETEYDFKLENCTTSSDQKTAARSGNEPSRLDQCKIEVQAVDDNVIARKISECGLGEVRVPASGCNDTDSDDSDDDLCSASDDDTDAEPYNPLASGIMPPVLPDIHLRVPMKDARDARRVKDALLIKGVLDVVCDEERQVVTVTGVVPPYRLLKKVRQLKSQARIISSARPFSVFVNPSLRPSAQIEERESAAVPIDIPTPHPIPHFVVRQQRPRPTFQQYTFHNDPHSPYLRTFSPSNLSPEDASHHFDSSFFDDDLYQGNGFIFT